MRCASAILSSVACLGLQYLSTFSHKRYDFPRKKLKMLALVFSTTFLSNILDSQNNLAIL
jgi:hypothetical protein